MNPAEEYMMTTPEPYKSVLLHLDVIIRMTVPSVQLKYKWKLPFYYLDDKTMFCFLNFRKKFVDLGLVDGNQLSDPGGVLIAGEGRKMLRSLRYASLEEINDEVLIATLEELKVLRLLKKKN